MAFEFYPHKTFNNPTAEDFFRTFAGDRIGNGVYRCVYEYLPDASLVLKVETDPHSFANIIENRTWNNVKDHKIAKFFAPCIFISPRGQFLIQKRTRALDGRNMPKKIPALIDDTHTDNWGIFENRVVCHDYGNQMTLKASILQPMKQAKWR